MISSKQQYCLIVLLLMSADVAILLNIPFLRQILGFIFLTILPGLLILQILKLDKVGTTEKFVLCIGISISFLMFSGLLLNYMSLGLGYEAPLSTHTLMISFNVLFIVLLIIGYEIKTFEKSLSFIKTNFSINLTASEKAFLIVPILFLGLSIFGMHVMNTTSNNIILILLFFLISIYVAGVCFFNQRFPKRLYPIVIFLIALSLLLMLGLRSNHLIGSDVHEEYYHFLMTLDNLHWGIYGHSTLDACLSISLLPTIYQSVLNICPEFFYKIFYPIIFSIAPLIVYAISRQYMAESFAFLSSMFFMSQEIFLAITSHPRTSLSILFFALAMMLLFNNKIDLLNRRLLFIVFVLSCVISHYATTYIFFFILLGAFVGLQILSKKHTFKKPISLTSVILFFAFIFLWYSQVTMAPFNSGIEFFENTFLTLNEMFIGELREEPVRMLAGEGLLLKGMAYKLKFISNWLAFIFIGIGITTLMIKFKEMANPDNCIEKPKFLINKFGFNFSCFSLLCAALLAISILVPQVTKGYSLNRVYLLAIVILSPFFVIGGFTLSKFPLFLKKKTDAGESDSKNLHFLVILLVLIFFFWSSTGVIDVIFGRTQSIILTSEGINYDLFYIRDQESYGAKWLKAAYGGSTMKIYTEGNNKYLFSQGKISPKLINRVLFPSPVISEGYIVMRYSCIDRDILKGPYGPYNRTKFVEIFGKKNNIYGNGMFEIWMK